MPRVGCGWADITPEPGLPMVGMPGSPRGEGVQWPLRSRVFLVDDGGRRIAVVCLDLMALVSATRRRAPAAAGGPRRDRSREHPRRVQPHASGAVHGDGLGRRGGADPLLPRSGVRADHARRWPRPSRACNRRSSAWAEHWPQAGRSTGGRSMPEARSVHTARHGAMGSPVWKGPPTRSSGCCSRAGRTVWCSVGSSTLPVTRPRWRTSRSTPPTIPAC